MKREQGYCFVLVCGHTQGHFGLIVTLKMSANTAAKDPPSPAPANITYPSIARHTYCSIRRPLAYVDVHNIWLRIDLSFYQLFATFCIKIMMTLSPLSVLKRSLRKHSYNMKYEFCWAGDQVCEKRGLKGCKFTQEIWRRLSIRGKWLFTVLSSQPRNASVLGPK